MSELHVSLGSTRAAAAAIVFSLLTAVSGYAAITRDVIASGLSAPLYVTAPPDDTERLFVVQRSGTILIIDLETETVNGTAYLNVNDSSNTNVSTSGEGGLLSMAFHPDYDTNGYFFVYYTTSLPGTGFTSRVSRFTVSGNPDVADPATELVFLEVDQPFTNHNGGTIAFHPFAGDNYLYLGLGDGGNACDPLLAGQDLSSKLGKMLRIDVDSGPSGDLQNPFAPPTNPYVGISGDDLIWSLGLRNPFRWSFDRYFGGLYIGDVGQGTREEIDYEPYGSEGGTNFGWNAREGSIPAPCGTTSPTLPEMLDPITEYSHDGQSASVTGGSVYRGELYATMWGRYFFADFEQGTVWSCVPSSTSISDLVDHTNALNPGSQGIVNIGEDAAGNLYIVELSGTVSRIIDPASPIVDADEDGIVDAFETNTGTYVSPTNTGTNPGNADSDGDGFLDGFEVISGSNPNSAASNFPQANVYVEIGAGPPRYGTADNPTGTLTAAVPVVQSGGTVHFVNAGNTNETPTISKAMTILAEGGIVQVGAP